MLTFLTLQGKDTGFLYQSLKTPPPPNTRIQTPPVSVHPLPQHQTLRKYRLQRHAENSVFSFSGFSIIALLSLLFPILREEDEMSLAIERKTVRKKEKQWCKGTIGFKQVPKALHTRTGVFIYLI